MRRRNAKLLTALGAVGVSVLAASGALASANGTSNGGEIHLYEADTALAGTLGTVILTGAITDHGIDHQSDASENNRLVLSKGSFEINVNDLGGKLASIPLDPRTCSSDGSATAAVPIVTGSGTGAYQGISGTIQTKASVASILPRMQRRVRHERNPVSGRPDRTRGWNRLLQVARYLRPGGARRAVADLQPVATAHADSAALVVANRPTDAEARQRSMRVVRHFPRPAPRITELRRSGMRSRRSGMRSISPIKLEGANVSDGPGGERLSDLAVACCVFGRSRSRRCSCWHGLLPPARLRRR